MADEPRGFAKMKDEDPQKLEEIASEGGKAAHEKGTAHEFNSEEAAEAGKQRGSDQTNSDVSRNSNPSSSRGLGAMKEEGRDEEVSEIAAMGGAASHGGGRSSEDDEE